MAQLADGLRVFISYARADASAFAEDLVAGLEAAGFSAFLDRHDIAAGEDWQTRLGNLLAQADTMVFVLTPASVASERCAWEIERAEALSKRVIPVVAIDVAESATPERLRRLNYIFFTGGQSFGASLRQLAIALRTDVDWIREHTRLQELAARWRERNEAEELLLRGSELTAAQAWLAAWRPGAPNPTDLHRAFLNASDVAEAGRNSAERKRLEEVAAAQAEKEAVLKRAARANFLWSCFAGALLLLGLIGGAAGAFALNNLRNQLSTKETELAQASEQASAKQSELQTALANALAALDSAQSAGASGAPAQPATSSASAAPSASAEVRRPLELRPLRGQQAEVPVQQQAQQEFAREKLSSALKQVRIAAGWDVDVFYCTGPGQEARQAKAEQLVNALLKERDAQASGGDSALPFSLGRVRARPLVEKINSSAGYQVQRNEVRAEGSEGKEGDALRQFLAGAGVPMESRVSGTRTAFYLSAFVCE